MLFRSKVRERVKRNGHKGVLKRKPNDNKGLRKDGMPDKRSQYGKRIIEKMQQVGEGKAPRLNDEELSQKRQDALEFMKNWDPNNYVKDPNIDIAEISKLALEAVDENRAKRLEVTTVSNANYLDGL